MSFKEVIAEFINSIKSLTRSMVLPGKNQYQLKAKMLISISQQFPDQHWGVITMSVGHFNNPEHNEYQSEVWVQNHPPIHNIGKNKNDWCGYSITHTCKSKE